MAAGDAGLKPLRGSRIFAFTRRGVAGFGQPGTVWDFLVIVGPPRIGFFDDEEARSEKPV